MPLQKDICASSQSETAPLTSRQVFTCHVTILIYTGPIVYHSIHTGTCSVLEANKSRTTLLVLPVHACDAQHLLQHPLPTSDNLHDMTCTTHTSATVQPSSLPAHSNILLHMIRNHVVTWWSHIHYCLTKTMPQNATASEVEKSSSHWYGSLAPLLPLPHDVLPCRRNEQYFPLPSLLPAQLLLNIPAAFPKDRGYGAPLVCPLHETIAYHCWQKYNNRSLPPLLLFP